MRRISALMFVIGGMLAGCAGNMQALRGANDPSTAAANDASMITIGEPGGYQSRNAAVSVPAGVCDKTAFIEGYQREYILQWNTAVRDKQTLYELQAKQDPTNQAAKHNHSLYKDKTFQASDRAPPDLHPAGGSVHNCRSDSFQKGRNEAMEAVERDLAEIGSMERK